MVHKSCKYDLYTGNTIRRYYVKRHLRINGDQHFVVKWFENINDVDTDELEEYSQDAVPDGELEWKSQWCPVMYSLNKRNRWNLRDRLLNAIDRMSTNNFEESSHYGFVLVEGHINYDENNCTRGQCIGYHDSLAKQCNHALPQKTYSFAKGLRDRCEMKSNSNGAKHTHDKRYHNQHFRGVQRTYMNKNEEMEEDSVEPELPRVHYEIYEPTLTSRCMMGKFDDGRKTHYDYGFRRGHKSKFKCKGRKKLHNEIIGLNKNELGFLPDVSNVVTHDLPREYVQKHNKQEMRPRLEVCLKDCVTNKKWRSRLKSKQSAITNEFRYTTPTPTVEIPTKDDDSDQTVTKSQNAKSTNSLFAPHLIIEHPSASFNCCMHPADLHPKELERLFGNSYIEGLCLPRKFLLNISESLENVSTWVRPPELLVVFEVVESVRGHSMVDGNVTLKASEEIVNGYALQNVRVFVQSNIKEKLLTELLSRQSNHGYLVTPSDVTDWLIRQFKWFPSDCVLKSEHVITSTVRPITHSSGWISTVLGWENKFYSFEEACQELSETVLLRHKYRLKKQRSTTVVNAIHDSRFIYCEICLDPVEETVLNATALISCGHWFCNECWLYHLTERIHIGDTALECPGYECESTLDYASLLSLVPYSLYQKYLSLVNNAKIDQHPQWKWCPNAICEQLVLINNTDGEEQFQHVDCVCGLSWCFGCQDRAHWPISCSQAEKYYKMLKQDGEFDATGGDRLTYFVKVKKCPECKHPMEKNGGCQHMSCRCGNQFCWECLGSWMDHVTGSMNCSKNYREETVMELVDIRNYNLPMLFYKRALVHRRLRRKMNKGYMKKLVTRCYNRLLNSSNNKSQDTRSNASLVCIGTSLNQLPLEKKNAQSTLSYDFVFSCMQFIVEMYFLMEYTNVLLSKCSQRNRYGPLEENISRLDFITARLKEIISGEDRKTNQTLPRLRHFLSIGKTCARKTVNGAKILQSKLHQPSILSVIPQKSVLKEK